MKRQVLFIQGGGEDVHDSWDNHLVDSLASELGDSYQIVYPRMPDEADPHYRPWAEAIGREVGKLDDGAIVVGHSLGAMMLIHAIAESSPNTKLGGLFLIATPYVGKGGWPSDEIEERPALGKDLPEDLIVRFYHGDADDEVPIEHDDLYRKAVPQAVVTTLKGRDHQLGNDLSDVAADILTLG